MKIIAYRRKAGGQSSRTLTQIVRATVLVLVAIGAGCNGVQGQIQSVELPVGQTLGLGNTITVRVRGTGSCPALSIDWGDGTVDRWTNYDLTIAPARTHVYSGWGGGKTVTAIATMGCIGRALTRFRLTPTSIQIAYNSTGPLICNPIPGKPALTAPSAVHITASPATHTERGIDYGCFAGGCVWDLDGKPGSVAAKPPFAFAGFREFSLIVSVGSQMVQGGMDTQFTASANGVLTVCLNDIDLPTNNRGGYTLTISVDQLGPPAPP